MMSAPSTRSRIPAHLRQYVVEQDPSHYDAIDDAVWRFVLLLTYARLEGTAHPAYRTGIAQTGLDTEAPASIAEMDRCLAKFGWGAVAVDGFIPPRAFMEFQSLRIMTIAAEIRTFDHAAYTPAPDLLHESVGHAPIIPDPQYRAFLERIGQVGLRAFSLPEDRSVYDAVRRLSDIKERADARPTDVEAAERALERAVSELGPPSEAALMSRLHWWTVEYGLVGTPQSYEIYGAGLLSSLGESHFCHDPKVRKLPLSRDCIEYPYDITRPQPQLFVAESFTHLQEVTEDVAAELAQCRGGRMALERAIASREVATVRLDSGIEIIGRLDALEADGAYLSFGGPCALAHQGEILTGHHTDHHAQGYGTAIGPLANGTALATLARGELEALCAGAEPIRFASGVSVAGQLRGVVGGADGAPLLLSLDACTVRLGDTVLFRPEWGVFDLAIGTRVRSACAGSSDPDYWPATEFSGRVVPAPRARTGAVAELLELYHRSLEIWKNPQDPTLEARFAEITDVLDRAFPNEWMLRFNLLECLRKVGACGPLAGRLREKLLEIESRAYDTVPATTALAYLDRTYPR